MDHNNNQNDNYQSPYQPSDQSPYQPSNAKKGFAVASLVCGIIGLLFSLYAFGNPYLLIFAFVLSILAIVFSSKGRKLWKYGIPGRGLAIAGLVLGIIAIVIAARPSAKPQKILKRRRLFRQNLA